MRILSVDPGQAYGIAICEDGTVTYSEQATMPAKLTKMVHAARELAIFEARFGKPDLVTVEQPAIKGGGSSFDSQAGQWANIFCWRHAAELAGLPVQWVNPASWRALMLRRVKAVLQLHDAAQVKDALQRPQADLTELAIGYAVGNDECAAIWMALWACEHSDELTPEARKLAKRVKAVANKAKRERKAAQEGGK